ncbi:MAG: hypothetical protein CMJ75_14250 [Planctomycetaceae bacterium]|nr:hypothetical protein [Planctomycetaceae bacterium]
MAVHDEIVALCTEMDAAGERITYDAILARRGGGSRRDIAKGVRAWRKARIVDAIDGMHEV